MGSQSDVHPRRAYTCGLRVIIMYIGNLPMFFLIAIAPVFAIHQRLVVAPDILLSDIMAATPLLRSLYATGLTLMSSAVVITYSEFFRSMKVRTVDPNARRAMDQILVIVWCNFMPCIIILTSFMFEEPSNPDGSYSIPSSPEIFVQWFMHVAATTAAFAGLGLCAFLYLGCIAPHAAIADLETPEEIACKCLCAKAIIATVICGLVVRIGHVWHSRSLWAAPLLAVEIITLTFAGVANTFGLRLTLGHLDATQPLVSWRNVNPSAWASSLTGSPGPQQRAVKCEACVLSCNGHADKQQ